LSRTEDVILKRSGTGEGAFEEALALEAGLSRSALKEVLVSLEARGRGTAVRGRFFSGDGFIEKRLSPFEKQILQTLREAGTAGVNPVFLRISGALEVLDRLGEKKLAVRLEENLYWSEETLVSMACLLLADQPPGSRLTIARAREKTGLSRRFVLPLMGILEQRGFLIREGDERVVRGDKNAKAD